MQESRLKIGFIYSFLPTSKPRSPDRQFRLQEAKENKPHKNYTKGKRYFILLNPEHSRYQLGRSIPWHLWGLQGRFLKEQSLQLIPYLFIEYLLNTRNYHSENIHGTCLNRIYPNLSAWL